MSDLFDTLSARFSPGATPTIRPRPQSRFEGQQGQDGPVEEDATSFARAPDAPVRATPRAPDGAPEAPPGEQAERPERTETPAARPVPPDEEARRQPAETQASAPAETVETTHGASPPPKTIPVVKTPDPEVPEQPGAIKTVHTTKETLRETRIETRVNEAAPEPPAIQTRRADLAHRDESRATRLEQVELKTTIRIGRIEVRQPAPPPTPAAAPPPPRPVATGPARPMGGQGQARGSGLTDYLGWKRR